MKRIKKRKVNKYKQHIKEKVFTHEINLSESDRITYSYKKVDIQYTEVVNSSYETKIDNDWITLVRFDTTHGYLHRHTRFSLADDKYYVTKENVSGDHHQWLTWTLRNLIANFDRYKTIFFTRNGID